MLKNVVFAALAAASIAVLTRAQELPVIFRPSRLLVGSGAQQLSVYRQDITAGLTFRVNGQARTADPPSTNRPTGGYYINLAPEDTAKPGFAEITALDSRNGNAPVWTAYVPIGYDVRPLSVVYDSVRKRFYIATPPESKDPHFPPNSIVSFDPESGQFGPVTSIGAVLGPLALAGDSSVLYVVLIEASTVRRFEPDSLSAAGDFRFRSATASGGSISSAYRIALAVMPGRPDTVALYYHPDAGSSLARLAIFDNGVKRPSEISSYGGYSLLFSDDGTYLYQGILSPPNNEQTLQRFSVDSTGFPPQTPVTGSGGAPVIISDGRLYTSHGTILNAATMETLGATSGGYNLAIDVEKRRLYTVDIPRTNDSLYAVSLQVFDLTTVDPLGSQPLGNSNYSEFTDGSTGLLLRFGDDGFLYTANDAMLVFHSPLARTAPVLTAAGVINAASLTAGPIAPSEIITLYGTNLGPDENQAALFDKRGQILPGSHHVQVWFGRFAGTVLFASRNQVNVTIPAGLAVGATVPVQVWYFGIPSAKVMLPVRASAPGLFTRDGTGRGLAALVNQDGTVNTPAPPGSIITLFGTGGVTAGAKDGTLASTAQPIMGETRVTIGGTDAKVLYAGAAPGLPQGVFQINVEVPAATARGTQPGVVIRIAGEASPEGVTIEIR